MMKQKRPIGRPQAGKFPRQRKNYMLPLDLIEYLNSYDAGEQSRALEQALRNDQTCKAWLKTHMPELERMYLTPRELESHHSEGAQKHDHPEPF